MNSGSDSRNGRGLSEIFFLKINQIAVKTSKENRCPLELSLAAV